MKRDMELVRKILVAIEDFPHLGRLVPLQFDGVTDDAISYHVKLLYEHGLIDAMNASTLEGIDWRAKGLSWDGHDFIEAIRDESRWTKVKAWVVDAGKVLTLETLKLGVKSLFTS